MFCEAVSRNTLSTFITMRVIALQAGSTNFTLVTMINQFIRVVIPKFTSITIVSSKRGSTFEIGAALTRLLGSSTKHAQAESSLSTENFVITHRIVTESTRKPFTTAFSIKFTINLVMRTS